MLLRSLFMSSIKTKVNVDMSKADDVCCDKCSGTLFQPVFHIKRLSALVSPSGQETYIPLQTFACVACGHINENF